MSGWLRVVISGKTREIPGRAFDAGITRRPEIRGALEVSFNSIIRFRVMGAGSSPAAASELSGFPAVPRIIIDSLSSGVWALLLPQTGFPDVPSGGFSPESRETSGLLTGSARFLGYRNAHRRMNILPEHGPESRFPFPEDIPAVGFLHPPEDIPEVFYEVFLPAALSVKPAVFSQKRNGGADRTERIPDFRAGMPRFTGVSPKGLQRRYRRYISGFARGRAEVCEKNGAGYPFAKPASLRKQQLW